VEEMYYIFECDMWRGYRISIPGNWAILARARTSIASISGFVRDLLMSSLAWISVQAGAYRGASYTFPSIDNSLDKFDSFFLSLGV
jgi:hypothetical protein